MIKYGETNWDDTDGSNDQAKEIWLRLKEGNNEMRVVTSPFKYVSHKYHKDEDDKFGQKVYCSLPGTDASCPLCEVNNPTQTRYLLGVIDRETQAFKILDFAYVVHNQISALTKSKWGPPNRYDINIIKNSKAKTPAQFYIVQPVEKSPLSAADQDIVDRLDLDDMKKRVTPPSRAATEKRIENIINSVKANAQTQQAPNKSVLSSASLKANMAAKQQATAQIPTPSPSTTETTSVVVTAADDTEEFAEYNDQ